MKGFKFSINEERFSASVGKLSETPSINPPAKFPSIRPIPLKTCTIIDMPLLRNSSSIGIYENIAPIIANTSIMANKTAPSTPAPTNAAGATAPTPANIINAIAIPLSSIANANAVSILGSTFIEPINPRTTASKPTTTTMIPIPANAIGDMDGIVPMIFNATDNESINIANDAAAPIVCFTGNCANS